MHSCIRVIVRLTESVWTPDYFFCFWPQATQRKNNNNLKLGIKNVIMHLLMRYVIYLGSAMERHLMDIVMFIPERRKGPFCDAWLKTTQVSNGKNI